MGKATEKRNKKNIFLRIVLFIFFGIIVIGVCVAIWQKDNLKSVAVATQYSKEEIADKIAASKEKTDEALKQYQIPVTRDFTLEEEEEIRKGTLSVDDAVKRIMASSADAEIDGSSSEVAGAGDSGNGGSTTAVVDPVSKTVGEHVAQMYELKAYYIGRLGEMSRSLKKQYDALDGSQKNAAGVSKVLKNNLGSIASLESECDSKVEAVLDDLKSDLSSLNADTSIVQSMMDAYENEKSLRKSYYLNLYN